MRSKTRRPITATLVAGALAATLTLGLGAQAAPPAPARAAGQPAGWTGFGPCSKPELAAYECGTLTVRLDRTPGTHDRRTLDLSVLQGGNPDADRTLLFLTGGPGQPGPILAPRILPAFDGIEDDYRILMLDQRGTGDHPLNCPELQEQRGFSDLRVPTADAVRDCAAIIGPDRAHYATTDSVADFEDLRRALGVREWAIDGVSYGTYTGQRYAAAHPDRVTHLVLDSIIPVTAFEAPDVANYPDYTRVLHDVCAEPGRNCPGDMAEDLHTILIREPGLGPMMFDLVTTVAYADATTFLDLPTWLHEGAAGNMAPLHDTYAVMHDAFAAPIDQYSQGIQAATWCADLDFPWGGANSPERIRDRLAHRDAAGYSDAELYPFNAEAARGNGWMTLCEYWPRVADRVVPADRLSLRGVNALLFNGERDLGTPLGWAEEAHRQIPGSELVVVPNAGHSLQISRKYPVLVNQAVTDFLLSD